MLYRRFGSVTRLLSRHRGIVHSTAQNIGHLTKATPHEFLVLLHYPRQEL